MDPMSKLQKLQNAIITSNSNGINQAPKRIHSKVSVHTHMRLKHHLKLNTKRKRFCDNTLSGVQQMSVQWYYYLVLGFSIMFQLPKMGSSTNFPVVGPNMCDNEDVCTQKEERAPSS